MPTGKEVILPDTNSILRYLLKDDKEQYHVVENLFENIRTGAEKAMILEGVLVECVYILMKFYKVPKGNIADILSNLLRYKGILNKNKEMMIEALALYAIEGLDIVDCLLYVNAKNNGMKLLSFDKRLMRLMDKA